MQHVSGLFAWQDRVASITAPADVVFCRLNNHFDRGGPFMLKYGYPTADIHEVVGVINFILNQRGRLSCTDCKQICL